MEESYLVAKTIRTAKAQTIALPPPVNANAQDKANLELIRVEVVKSVAKKQQKLEESLKKGYATVYNQCSQEVQDKLKATKDWDIMQSEQSLHKLIRRIEKICVGFDDHKQSVFNLVQSLKTLFLYSQSENETVEEYTRNKPVGYSQSIRRIAGNTGWASGGRAEEKEHHQPQPHTAK